MSDPIEEELARRIKHHADNYGEEAGAAQTESNNSFLDSLEVPSKPAAAMPVAPTILDRGVEAKPQTPVITSRTMPDLPPVDVSKPLGAAPPQDTELRGLQDDAKRRRTLARLGQSISDFTERPDNALDAVQRISGHGSTPNPKSSIWKDYEAEGPQAIADLEERRKSEAGMAAGQKSAANEAELSDPNSSSAKQYRAVLLKFAPDLQGQLVGANAKQMLAMAPWLEKYGHDNADLLKAKSAAEAKAIEEAKRDAEKKTALELAAKHYDQGQINHEQSHQDSLGMQRAILSDRRSTHDEERAEKAKGHQTSPSTLTDLADAETAINELGPLGQKFKDLGMSGSAAKISGKVTDMLDLQGTDAAEYKAAALRAMQGVGKIMEGGKLATSDEDKYRRMLPRPGDAPEIADQKIKESQSFLRNLKDQRIKTLRGGGYNVPDIGGQATQATKAVDHYLVSPDKKRRVAVYSDGTEGAEEAVGG